MSSWDVTGTYDGIPQSPSTVKENGGHLRSKQNRCGCSPGWEVRGLFYLGIFFALSFVALMVLVAIVVHKQAPGFDLMQRSTIAMHDESKTAMDGVSTALRDFRSKFPSNQEEVTVEQILDSIDKGHVTMVWVKKMTDTITPVKIDQMWSKIKSTLNLVGAVNINQIDQLINNVNSLVLTFSDALSDPNEEVTPARKREIIKRKAMLDNVGTMLQKGGEFVNSISVEEFHSTFIIGKETLATVSALGQRMLQVDHEAISRIVKSVDKILGSAQEDHIIDWITHAAQGAVTMIDRFSTPVSLPVSGLGSK